jgi:16S rRNA (guanine527-N7)-methyltransferase
MATPLPVAAPTALPTPLPTSCGELLERGAADLGLILSPDQHERLLELLRLLQRWNRVYNLTAIRDPLEMVPRHLLDSLALVPHLHGPRVLDLGSGPGLPGLPLAICEPARQFCLLDANGKKVRFIRHAVVELGLTNVAAVQTRMQSYRPPQKFSTIVSRAVSTVAAILTTAAPLLGSPGRVLVMKGRFPADELQDLELADSALGALDLAAHPLTVPFLEGQRHLIEIRRP